MSVRLKSSKQAPISPVACQVYQSQLSFLDSYNHQPNLFHTLSIISLQIFDTDIPLLVSWGGNIWLQYHPLEKIRKKAEVTWNFYILHISDILGSYCS